MLLNRTRCPRFMVRTIFGTLRDIVALDLFIYGLPFEASEVDDRSRRCDVEWGNDMSIFGKLAGHDVNAA
jgi:hypothetical protein